MNYRAFVSSTFEDLKDHRAHVIRTLRRAGFIVDPMEDWPADSDEPKQFSQNRLDDCDLCVLLVAFRRGYVPEGETRSITQLEYKAAVKQGVDILPFLLQEDTPWWAKLDERDKDPELKTWREHLRKNHGVETFTLDPSSIELTGALGRWFAKKKVGQPKRGVIERVEWPEEKSPYPGLEWFDEEYAPLFFGRDREVDDMIAKMGEPHGRFLLISGASGSGKSSLVAAGLWHALLKEGRLPGSMKWTWLRITPGGGKGPFDSLAWSLKQAFPRLTTRADDLANQLAKTNTTIGELLTPYLTGDQELLLFIDQLEELFTQGFKDADIQNFLDQLVVATRDPQNRLRVVTTVRSEFISRLEESESVLQVLNTGYNHHLGPVSPRILQEMIEKPAQATGYEFEPQLVDDLLDEAGKEPGSLPLVAYTLKQLFQRRQRGTFTREAYKAIGGVAGAIGSKADLVMETLGPDVVDLFDKVFAELVHIERDRPPTRKRVALATFKNDAGATTLIQALAGPDCRVLVTGNEKKDTTVSISHETLFEAWPLLREYVATNKKQLMDHTLLENRARKWVDMGKPWFTGLASGREFKDFQRVGETAIPVTRAYLHASRRARRLWHGVLVMVVLLFGGTTWLWQKNYNLDQALLKVQSIFVSLHIAPDMKTVSGGTYRQRDEKGFFGLSSLGGREVTLKEFALGKHEVTFEEYDRFAIETGRKFPGDQGWGRGRRPVMNVSWNNASAYAAWLSDKTGKRFRLPTESEWEYAARSGGSDERWAGTSDEEKLGEYAVYLGNSGNRTGIVGEKKPNGLGLHDMSGNVFEWVKDCWHDTFEGAPTDGTAWFEAGGGSCKVRIVRGGAWSREPSILRTWFRGGNAVPARYGDLGFRLAQDIP